MASIMCRCGCVMKDRTMEEDFLYDLIPSNSIQDVILNWKDIRDDIYADSLTNVYFLFRKNVYICPSCGRILIEGDEDPNLFNSYIKEIN